MNHYLGLIVLSVSIATLFSLIMKESKEERFRYFVSLLAYMIVGSLIAAWVMYPIPW